MERKKCQSTVLDPCSEEAQHSTKRGVSRREFVQTSAGVLATGALFGKRAFAAPKPLKIGYVSPLTGALATFGDADVFVIDQIRKTIKGGIMSGGATRPIEILVRDCQSNPNRAAEVTVQLIKSDQVELMMSAGSPDVVNPVADQCEINQVPCVTTDAPWEPYFFGRGGKPDKGFDWTYHFHFSLDDSNDVTADLFDQVPTNKVVGLLMANNTQGLYMADPERGCSPELKARGYTIIDPGRFQLETADFSAQIAMFKKANAEVLFGVIPLPTFAVFWTQAAQQGYKPKVCNPGEADLFPSQVEALGPRGKYLSSIIDWSRAYPFKSSLTGQSAAQYCDEYEQITKKQWTQTLGTRHAVFEVGLDVFKRAQNPESAASVIDAVRNTKLSTIAGPLQWQGPPPNKWTKIPVKNVCTIPLVCAQWVPGKKWMYDYVVVDSTRYPLVHVEAKMMPMPS